MIMLCRARTVSLSTLNGEKVLDQDVCHETDDRITACAFYEGSGNEYLERDLVLTGHRRGVVNVRDTILRRPQFCGNKEAGLELHDYARQIRSGASETDGSFGPGGL